MSDSEETTKESGNGGEDPSEASDAPPEEEIDEETALRKERDRLEERVAELEAERDALVAERDELESRVKRTAADFENYKKRQEKRRERERAEATEDLIERLLHVRDNLQRALDETNEEGTGLRDGVELTLNEFDRVLDAEDVQEISPEPGEPVDPQRHEVMMRVEGEQDDGDIEAVYRTGYEMNENVIRPAQVAVSKPEEPNDR